MNNIEQLNYVPYLYGLLFGVVVCLAICCEVKKEGEENADLFTILFGSAIIAGILTLVFYCGAKLITITWKACLLL